MASTPLYEQYVELFNITNFQTILMSTRLLTDAYFNSIYMCVAYKNNLFQEAENLDR